MTATSPRQRTSTAPPAAPATSLPDGPIARSTVDAGTAALGRWASLRRRLPATLLVGALIGGWELWVSGRHVDSFVMPTPGRVLRAGWTSAHLLPGHLTTTLTESIAGLGAGAIAGIALAVLIVRAPLARRVLYPLLVISQTIPMVVLAPLLVIWFGFGLTPKIVVVALIVFFPVLVSTVGGIDGADRDLIDLVRSMGAGQRQVLRLVLVPSAIPAFFAGLRIAAAYTVGGAVVAEYIGGSSGLGVFINRSKAAYAVDRIFVAVVVIALLTAVLFALVDVAARWAAPWQEPERGRRFRRRLPSIHPAPLEQP